MTAWCRHFVRIPLYCPKCDAERKRPMKPTYEQLEAKCAEQAKQIESLQREKAMLRDALRVGVNFVSDETIPPQEFVDMGKKALAATESPDTWFEERLAEERKKVFETAMKWSNPKVWIEEQLRRMASQPKVCDEQS